MNEIRDNHLTIGQVARRSGVGVETVRFYEREGLIAKPPRTGAGYRQFPPDTVDRIRFTQRAKELGFSLREIKDLLALRMASDSECEDIRQRAETKIADVNEKIRHLKRIKRVLSSLARECDEAESIHECPILRALEENNRNGK